jgi:diaminopimelate decarboxylase
VLEAAERAAELWQELAADGIELGDFDAGGGLGLAYSGEDASDLAPYATALTETASSLNATLLLEPGRHLIGPAGTFVTRVIRVKQAGGKTLAVCDGGSNDLLRPVLYGAEHPVIVLIPDGREELTVDLLALDRRLPEPRKGDLIAVGLVGAYGRVMSSMYNARPLCAEVVLEQGTWRVSRERGSYADLVRNERD